METADEMPEACEPLQPVRVWNGDAGYCPNKQCWGETGHKGLHANRHGAFA